MTTNQQLSAHAAGVLRFTSHQNHSTLFENRYFFQLCAMTSFATTQKILFKCTANAVHLRIPLYLQNVHAGFPSPAESYVDSALDFNNYLVSNPNATFAVYSSGDSMIDVGIYPGDLLVFDRSITPNNGDIIVASVGGEFTVKRLVVTALGIELHPENSTGQYSVIRPTDGVEITLVGVLTHSIKRFRKA